MGDSAAWQQRAETAEAASFHLQATIWFLVKDVRAYIARERRYRRGDDRLATPEQSAGIAEAVLREDEPWRAVLPRMELLEEQIAALEAAVRQAGHADACALQYGGACDCRMQLVRR